MLTKSKQKMRINIPGTSNYVEIDPGESLSPEEALIRSFEQTDTKLNKYRLDDHEDLKLAEKRMGKPMSHNELIAKITKLNPSIWAEDSKNSPGCLNFYTYGYEKVYYQDTQMKSIDKKKICLNAAFEKGWLPEFSFIIVDAADLPIKEKRGWRTVLLRLLAAKVLTFGQVLEVFGDAHGLNSSRWRMYTQRYR